MAYPYEPALAFPGMLADDGFTDKVTLPAAVSIPLGGAVHRSTTGTAILPGAGTPFGVAIADALHMGGYQGPGYVATDAVPVLRRGRIWVPVTAAGAITLYGPAKYAVDGTWSTGGALTFPNATFISALTPSPMGNVVQIELHDPSL